jgi:hypothetical protein
MAHHSIPFDLRLLAAGAFAPAEAMLAQAIPGIDCGDHVET